MKKILKVFVPLIVATVLIVVGVSVYYIKADRIKGVFVRKVYGSYGNLANSNVYLVYEVFVFGDENIDYLKDKTYLTLNNSSVNIDSLDLNIQNEVKDLKIYDMTMDLKINSYGTVSISKLQYNKGEEQKEIDLGNLDIVNLNYENESLAHGAQSSFSDNNIALFSFLGDNSYSFTIEEILYSTNCISYSNYTQNLSYKMGERLAVEIEICFTVNQFDKFIFLPIFKLRVEDSDKIVYFKPITYVSFYKPMTYMQIREYVK